MASSKDGLEFLLYYKQLLDLLETNEDIRRTIIGVVGQMSWAASGAGVGGLVAGPPGALVGGIAGSVIGYKRSDDYSSMMGVLRSLTDEEKENLVNEVQGVVGSTAVENLSSFIGSPGQREVLVECIREFIKGCHILCGKMDHKRRESPKKNFSPSANNANKGTKRKKVQKNIRGKKGKKED